MQNSFEVLLNKLDTFIKKYYTNQLIKGAIYSVGLTLSFYLVLVLAEYFFYFPVVFKTILFFGYLTLSIIILARYILIPISRLLKLGKVISYKEAALLISKHFPDAADKALNALELQEIFKTKNVHSDLILAGIEQKINTIKPVPFQLAINLGENKQFLKYALVPIVIIILLAFTYPAMLSEGTSRIIDYNTAYEKPAPFYFQVNENTLFVLKNEDFNLTVTTVGQILPNEVFLNTGQMRFKMKKINANTFTFNFKNIQENQPFIVESNDVMSKQYLIIAQPKPVLKKLKATLQFPNYLNKNNIEIDNTSELLIPEGTKINWEIITSDVDKIFLETEDSSVHELIPNANQTTFRFTGNKNTLVTFKLQNKKSNYQEAIPYQIQVIPDQFPNILVNYYQDSLNINNIYFSGQIIDDYGFSQLTFYTQNSKATLPITKNLLQQNFYHQINLKEFGVKPGDEFSYFFEVHDNDGINGPKSTKSESITIKIPTKNQLDNIKKENDDEIKNQLEEALNDAKKLQEKIEDLSKKLLEKKNIGWEEKQLLNQLLEDRKSLEQKIESLQEKHKENIKFQDQYKNQSPEILEKQKKLEELFEKLMDDEMKELLKEMEKMMEKLDKSELQKDLEKFKLSNEDIEKELDRNLELFKQFEFQQKLEETIQKIEEVKEQQKEVEQKTNEKNASNEELQKEQEEVKKSLDELKKDLDELKEKNNKLEEKTPLPDTENDMNNIEKSMNDAQQNLQNNQKKKAQDSQKNAQDQLQQLEDKMNQFQEEQEMAQQEENLERMRNLLENLIQLSFDQENLMHTVKKLQRNDPNFVAANQEQKRLKDNAKMVEDSLFALSKRVAQLEPIINKEINAVNQSMEKSTEFLVQRNSAKSAERQQFAMTSLNNLALLLDEAVQSMQQNMSAKKFGNKSCSKPGSGMPSISEMKKAQQALNKKLQEMMKGQEEGKNPNGKNPGGKGGNSSKEVAKLAAEQAAIREAIKQLQNEIEGKNGKAGSGELKKLQDLMEKTEEDLVNWQLSRETLRRQEEILTRLLESEKAEKEREQDNKRESKEATPKESEMSKYMEDYQKQKQKEVELLKTIPPNLNNYYKSKVSEYFNQL